MRRLSGADLTRKIASVYEWIEVTGKPVPHILRHGPSKGREVLKPCRITYCYGRYSKKQGKFRTQIEIVPARIITGSRRNPAKPAPATIPIYANAWRLVTRRARIKGEWPPEISATYRDLQAAKNKAELLMVLARRMK